MFGHQDDQNSANDQPNDNNQQAVTTPEGEDLEKRPEEKPADLPAPQHGDNAKPSGNRPTDHHSTSAKGPSAGGSDLLSVKQQALQQLSPLVDHLDQTPEEKFRTTMMMIQAADDQSLIQRAYEAAQGIKDEKVRAQALLDIVNEINYFTQHNEAS